MDFLLPLFAAALGAAAAWFAARAGADRRTAAALATLKDQHAEALRRAEADLAGARADVRNATDRADRAENELGALRTRHEADREKLAALEREHETLSGRLQTEFENLSTRILEQNAKKFAEQSQANLAGVLDPLKVRIGEFQEQVKAAYDTELREKASLKEQINQLAGLNREMSLEAQNLVKALKGESKTQGNWGEMILERVLERSGLTKGSEYDTQQGYKETGTGRTVFPDAVVKLPQAKHIIIDSKVSLVAYERHVSAEDEAARAAALKEHLASIRSHVKALSGKEYHNLEGMNSPDFVLLFIPVEPAFLTAIQADPDLYNEAFGQDIIIVSPTTLLATLSTIKSVWRQEYRNKNAEEIARQAGALHAKFVGFLGDFDKVGKQLDQLRTTFDAADNKLRSGKGNLVSGTAKLEKLGAKVKASKSLAAVGEPDSDAEDSDD